MAYDILVNKKDPAEIKVEEVSKTTKMFNSSLAEKFNISIPSDYVSLD